MAVTTLLQWYRSGEDIDAQMPALQGYLGHVSPEGTYWYYSDFRVIPILAPLRA
jgi:integrase/recombinase XerD